MGIALSIAVLLILAGGYAAHRAIALRRLRARTEERDGGAPRPAHYSFTRQVLAMGVLKAPGGLERLVSEKGHATVAAAFQYAASQHPFEEPLSTAPSIEAIEGGVLVVMPPAERRGEAYFVAAVRSGAAPRYFLLEKAEQGCLFVELVLRAGQLVSTESFAGSTAAKELFVADVLRRVREQPAPATKPRPLHYAFAHRMLPRCVSEDSGFAVSLLRDPERAIALWNETAASLSPADALDPSTLRVEAWGKSGQLVLVHMPAPEQLLEAHVVAVAQRSCFVLERGTEGPFISEWATREGRLERTRYDERLDQPDAKAFATFVMKTLRERGEPVICCPYCILPTGDGWDACPFCERDPRRDARIEFADDEAYFAGMLDLCQTCGQACHELAVVCPGCKGRPFPPPD